MPLQFSWYRMVGRSQLQSIARTIIASHVFSPDMIMCSDHSGFKDHSNSGNFAISRISIQRSFCLDTPSRFAYLFVLFLLQPLQRRRLRRRKKCATPRRTHTIETEYLIWYIFSVFYSILFCYCVTFASFMFVLSLDQWKEDILRETNTSQYLEIITVANDALSIRDSHGRNSSWFLFAKISCCDFSLFHCLLLKF